MPDGKAMWYAVCGGDGNVLVHLSAATVLGWHFAQLRGAGEHTVFEPAAGQDISREGRQEWLRGALLAALPRSEQRAREMVSGVTPHSFRPGLAGDLLRDGWQLDAIAVKCRWQGTRNARMYAERMALGDARRKSAFRRLRADWA